MQKICQVVGKESNSCTNWVVAMGLVSPESPKALKALKRESPKPHTLEYQLNRSG